jgi:transcriptional regulatory protein LevR
MNLDERLDILALGKVISEDVARAMRRVVERFSAKWRIELTEESGGRMVTHLAMALMRIGQNTEISPPEANQFEEFKSSEYFSRAVEITDDICAWTPLELPDAERQYLIIYVCLILDDFNGY